MSEICVTNIQSMVEVIVRGVKKIPPDGNSEVNNPYTIGLGSGEDVVVGREDWIKMGAEAGPVYRTSFVRLVGVDGEQRELRLTECATATDLTVTPSGDTNWPEGTSAVRTLNDAPELKAGKVGDKNVFKLIVREDGVETPRRDDGYWNKGEGGEPSDTLTRRALTLLEQVNQLVESEIVLRAQTTPESPIVATN